MNPGAVRYLRQRQRQDLEALGYRIESDFVNFRKETEIRTSSEAEAVAREILGIFFRSSDTRGSGHSNSSRTRANVPSTNLSTRP